MCKVEFRCEVQLLVGAIGLLISIVPQIMLHGMKHTPREAFMFDTKEQRVSVQSDD